MKAGIVSPRASLARSQSIWWPRLARHSYRVPRAHTASETQQGWNSVVAEQFYQFRQTGFAKGDAELRRLLNRIYSASDAPAQLHQRRQLLQAPVRGVPVYVMLPLDTVWLIERDGQAQPMLIREKAMEVGLEALRAAGVEGVMVDVWWGIAEHGAPQQYNFSAYKRLFEQVAAKGLKIQAVMSFHAAGGNVGDTCKISLPKWVLEAGDRDPNIFFTDRAGVRNKECISVGCDDLPVLGGRTPVNAYADFITAFADEFNDMLGTVITEVTVGLGPAGELRYPSYPEGDGRWRFPGVGEFQCYDSYMLRDLRMSALAVGHPEWGHGGPHDAGHYNSSPCDTGFFLSHGGNWDSDYGRFFLSWYSGLLTQHADRILSAASEVLRQRCRPRRVKEKRELSDGQLLFTFRPAVQLGVKLAGVHWWFKSRTHAAELTAGYYNTRDCNGYKPIMKVLARNGACVNFTCVEMRDCEHPIGRCSPQGLLNQVISTASEVGVPVAGENALQRYDRYAFDRITESAFGQSAMMGRLEKVTFLRMGDMMYDNWEAFSGFLRRLTCPPQ